MGALRTIYRYGPYTSAESLPRLMSESHPSDDKILKGENENALSPYHSYYHVETSFEEMKFCYLLGFANEEEKLVAHRLFLFVETI